MNYEYKSGYNCNYCGKKHTRKTSHDRHIILCEIIYSSKRDKKCNEEEITDIPNQLQLYKMVQELAIKNSILEDKMNEMQKWLDKKKKKINVTQWLSSHRVENISAFSEWQKKLLVTSDHIELLIEENIVKTICQIIDENIRNSKEIPIACFHEKTNIFYIYNSDKTWRRLTPQEFILFVQHIHKQIWREMSIWKEKNNDNLNKSEKMCDLYARTLIKLSGLNFEQDSSAMSKIRTHLYSHLKMELKNMIDYEFEF